MTLKEEFIPLSELKTHKTTLDWIEGNGISDVSSMTRM